MSLLRSHFAGAILLAAMLSACGPGSQDPQQSNSRPAEEPSADSFVPAPIPSEEAPPVISDYEQTFIDSGLVDIQEFIPGIQIDLKYSTTDNFVHTDVYGDLEKVYLRPEAAEKLKKAQELLQQEHPGYSLLVWDGVRPHRVQYKMWEVLDVPNKRNYLSPPDKGSVHNYGCAVDLGIVDSTGLLLDMGTPFDFFGELAQPKLEAQMLARGELSQAQLDNRLLLRRIMRSAGFYDIRTEWWHFNAFGSLTVKSRFSLIP